MIKEYTFRSIFLISLILSFTIIAQEATNIGKFSSEIPAISGGAENSILIEKLKRTGDTSTKYQEDKSTRLPRDTNSPSSTSTITTIEGINFDEDASLNGSYHIPPDPSGAIGPNHLVSVNNTSIEWFTRAGGNQNSQSLLSFFAPLSPATGTFDPKVIYDQYEGRFVVVTLERTHSAVDSTSKIYLAVSATSDPNGAWYYYAINSKINVGGIEYWADYPGFAVGTDGIYVTCNLFHFTTGAFGGVRLWVIDKGTTSGFYSGGTASSVVRDPTSVGGNALTLQPAHMFGTPPAGVGTYLVGYSRLASGSNSFIEIYSVSNSVSSPIVTFPGFLNIGVVDDFTVSIPNAPQLGTSNEIETNDPRTYNAVWRNNLLYTGTIVIPPSGADAGQVTAHWIELNAASSSVSLSDQGNISGEDIGTGTHTFFPSVAVNAIGEMMVGFAASGPTIYPGAYYTFRFPYETSGTVQSSKTLKAGVDYYYRAFGGSRNRWGDYTGSSVDPNNDITFCLYNEYALARGTVLGSYPSEDGRWGTVFGVMPNLDLTVLLEGPYAGGSSMTTGAAQNAGIPLAQPYNVAPWNYLGLETITSLPPNIADWVLVTLRKDINPLSPDPATAVDVASRAAFLKTDGTIVDLNGSAQLGFSVEPGNYYIVVYHRNHLPIMSPTAITL